MTALTPAERTQLLNFLASMPGLGHDVVDRDELRDLLRRTGGQIMARGSLWEITSKHIGGGMYRVSTKRWSR